MPSTRLKQTKDGRPYYEIRVRVSRDKSELSSRWYVPEGWSRKAIDKELTKQAAEFERKCKAGEVLSRADKRAIQEEAEREAAKIQTLRQYGENVFMPSKRVTCAENTRDGCPVFFAPKSGPVWVLVWVSAGARAGRKKEKTLYPLRIQDF